MAREVESGLEVGGRAVQGFPSRLGPVLRLQHLHQSQKGIENIPVSGTNRRRGKRIYPYQAPIAEGERKYSGEGGTATALVFLQGGARGRFRGFRGGGEGVGAVREPGPECLLARGGRSGG
eukprot:1177093-Prorocentrum_minimum.AAC.1